MHRDMSIRHIFNKNNKSKAIKQHVYLELNTYYLFIVYPSNFLLERSPHHRPRSRVKLITDT